MPTLTSFAIPCQKNIASPMQKYTMIPERLLAEGTISQDNFFAPARLSKMRF
ncbi:hypothetical protein JCM18901_1943 [Psychrobacter sp. JCM 18901]|nr:hypothetical protein JCM18901_1943 [Psychrobacter sp. JCM 18901]